ncbi:MAG: ComEC/Rec2 family competence protein, partial [bacterium]
LPLTAFYFGKVSIVGLLTNGIILPLIGASIMLGFISSLVGWISFFIADSFAAVNGLLLALSLAIAKFSGGLSWAYVETLQFKPIHAIPYFAALGFFFHLRTGSVARKMVIAFLIAMNILIFVPVSNTGQSREGMLRASFIDVGQGDACLIEFPDGKTMLIDAGPKSADYDAGERIIIPFLKRKGIKNLDYIVASHPHADHIGGFASVFKAFDVSEVLESGQPARDPVYREYTEMLHAEKCRVDTARGGQAPIQISGANLYILYPTSTHVDPDTSHTLVNLNNTSVVLKLCYGQTSILFTGDAEHEAEVEVVRSYGDFLHSTLLKAGHHGSRTSSSQEFLEAVKPQYAVISVGLHNKFNHPSEAVLERMQTMNVEPLRTDEDGAIIFESDGETMRRIFWR